MEIFIDTEKVREAHQHLARYLDLGDSPVALLRYGRVDPREMQVLGSSMEWGEFAAGEPEPEIWEHVGAKSLYELLLDIDNNRIVPQFVEDRGVLDRRFIDISRMLDDRNLINSVHDSMERLDRSSLMSTDPAIRRSVNDSIAKINSTLLSLCKDEHGLAVAIGLWEHYFGDTTLTRPELFANRRSAWYVDNSLRPAEKVHFSNSDPERKPVKPDTTSDRAALRALQQQLTELGSLLDVSDKAWALTLRRHEPLYESQQIGPKTQADTIDIAWHIENGKINYYEIATRKPVILPEGQVDGVNLAQLAARMTQIDWDKVSYKVTPSSGLTIVAGPNKAELSIIEDDLKKLGREQFKLFALKFLAYGDLDNRDQDGLNILRGRDEKRLIVHPEPWHLTVLQAYNLLEGRSVMKSIGADGADSRTEFLKLDFITRSKGGYPRLVTVPDTEGLVPFMEITQLGGKMPTIEDLRAVANGSRILVTLDLDNIIAHRIAYLDPVQKTMEIDRAASQAYGLYQIPDTLLYKTRTNWARHSVDRMAAQMSEIGLNANLIDRMKERVIQYGKPFSLSDEIGINQDRMSVTVNFEKVQGLIFNLNSLTLDLRKTPEPTKNAINGVDIAALKDGFQSIDWRQDFTTHESFYFHFANPLGQAAMYARAQNIKDQLAKLMAGRDPYGRDIGGLLANFYLKGTPNQEILPGLTETIAHWEYKVTVPATPIFSLDALYNLMYHRYAIGKTENSGTETVQSKDWFELQRKKIRSDTDASFLKVKGAFSVSNFLGPLLPHLQNEFPEVFRQIVTYLEKGSQPTVSISDVPLQGSVQLYADPVGKCIMANLRGLTPADAAFVREAGVTGTQVRLDILLLAVKRLSTNHRRDRGALGSADSDSGKAPDSDDDRKRGPRR